MSEMRPSVSERRAEYVAGAKLEYRVRPEGRDLRSDPIARIDDGTVNTALDEHYRRPSV